MIGIQLLRGFLYLYGLLRGSRYKYSQVYEDNFKYMGIGEKVWWAYKALVKQIERAEPGRGIEDFFARQKLDFALTERFRVLSKATITAGGDLSSSEVITPDGTANLWDDVEDFYFSGDLVCANLECPVDPEKPVGAVPRVCLTAPLLNIAPEIFQRYTHGKSNILFATANNHSLDQGESGLTATLDFLDRNGYAHVGTARTPEEQSSIPVVNLNGIKVAFLSYTYCLNGFDPIPGKEYMTNVIRLNKPETDLQLIKEHVRLAHLRGADFIVALLHWSVEFETYPLENIITMGHRVMECGVDVILGGHPHVAQPMEKYTYYDPYRNFEKDGLILYSFGELASFNAFSRNSRLALLLKLTLARGVEDGKTVTRLAGLQVLPVYTWVRVKQNRADYRLMDFCKLVRQIDAGRNPHGFKRRQIRELKRLERLLYDRLLPEEYAPVLPQERGEHAQCPEAVKSSMLTQ